MLQYHIPQHVAQHRSDNAQKQQVARNDGIENQISFPIKRLIEKHRQQCNDAVKENLTRDKRRRITAIEFLDDKAVKSPKQRGRERKEVAQRIEVEHKMTVKDDDGHSGQCDERPHDKLHRQPVIAIKQPYDNRREQRCRAHYQGHVRGIRHRERRIFGKEIERTARKGPSHK